MHTTILQVTKSTEVARKDRMQANPSQSLLYSFHLNIWILLWIDLRGGKKSWICVLPQDNNHHQILIPYGYGENWRKSICIHFSEGARFYGIFKGGTYLNKGALYSWSIVPRGIGFLSSPSLHRIHWREANQFENSSILAVFWKIIIFSHPSIERRGERRTMPHYGYGVSQKLYFHGQKF